MLDKVDKDLLKEVAALHQIPQGAYNIRKNGEVVERKASEHITFMPSKDGKGLQIIISSKAKGESVHIPVILTKAGLTDVVTNEFIVETGADVTIVAGCGIHKTGDKTTTHSGIHTFNIKKGAKVKYIERHYGSGSTSGNEMHPETIIHLLEDAEMEMESVQLGGINNTNRKTIAKLEKNAKLKITEKILTEGSSKATTFFEANLNGEDSRCHIISRSVAKDNSSQLFTSIINGNNKCYGRTECDAIIVGNSSVQAKPEVNANHPDASLVHEASVGKLSGDEVTKLLTLGLTEKEAEETLLKGFLN